MTPARIVFLDRDGVLNAFPGKGMYVTRPDEFRMLPNSAKAVALLKKAGYEIFVITNQGCVSRKLITEDALKALHAGMAEAIAAEGGSVDGVFYCPHQTSDACECKKPKTALFRRAVEGRDVDFSRAFFVGDSEEDMAAGRALGCRTVLVLSGRTGEEDVEALHTKPDTIKKDLWEAARWIAEKS